MKVIISVVTCIVLLTIFIMIVYSVFTYSTVCHTNSISDIIQVLPSSSDIGGFDWIIILIWDIALFLYFTLNILGACYCIRQIIPKINKQVVSSVLLLVVLFVNLISHFDIIHTIELIKTYVSYFSAVIQYAFPLIFLIFSMFNKGTQTKENENKTFSNNEETKNKESEENSHKVNTQGRITKPKDIGKLFERKFVFKQDKTKSK